MSGRRAGEEGTNIRNNEGEGTTGQFGVPIAVYQPPPNSVVAEINKLIHLFIFGNLGSAWSSPLFYLASATVLDWGLEDPLLRWFTRMADELIWAVSWVER